MDTNHFAEEHECLKEKGDVQMNDNVCLEERLKEEQEKKLQVLNDEKELLNQKLLEKKQED